jgi:hypothetical protein
MSSTEVASPLNDTYIAVVRARVGPDAGNLLLCGLKACELRIHSVGKGPKGRVSSSSSWSVVPLSDLGLHRSAEPMDCLHPADANHSQVLKHSMRRIGALLTLSFFSA